VRLCPAGRGPIGKQSGKQPAIQLARADACRWARHTDTLAKLTWSLQHGELPDWAAAVGPSTLVIIDEAGMADTPTLDTTVQFAINGGASVRLVGDDQQLAAIGGGGVLRDITHIHGALRITELHRFTDPTEAAATLALREGKPEALNFYLDHGRVHVGDPATTTEDAFSAWVSDRAAGLDAIMLAPTRELVANSARQARRCSRSSAAMKRRSPPAPCSANSTTQRRGFSKRSSATPTASTSQPNSSSDPKPSQNSTIRCLGSRAFQECSIAIRAGGPT
jgi:hypothetical protein